MVTGRRKATGGWTAILLVVLAPILGCAHTPEPTPLPAAATERETLETARLTSPFLECPGIANADEHLVLARGAIRRFLEGARIADPGLRASVYARDLNNGPWIGIDENQVFFPASLSKVPVMLFILDLAEADPTILQRELVYPGPEGMTSANNMEGEGGDRQMEAGRAYSYEELLSRMIAHSDNHAMELLMADHDPEDVMALMRTMHSEGDFVDGELMMSPKVYAAFFRVLYNATLVNRHLSEYGLQLLTQGEFGAGLRYHIPKDVPVASKFGLRTDRWMGTGDLSFHECGIVYMPDSPYVLCVMTSSSTSSGEQLEAIVADVSRIVWEEKGGRSFDPEAPPLRYPNRDPSSASVSCRQ